MKQDPTFEFTRGNKTYRVPVEILDRNRKTIGIKVTQGPKIQLFWPLKKSKETWEGVLLQKKDWLIKYVLKLEDQMQSFKTHQHVQDTHAIILGVTYPIFTEGVGSRDQRVGALSYLKDYFAPIIITKRFYYWLNTLVPDLKNEHVILTVRHAKTRWGSCSSKKRIMINKALFKAPLFVLDYVIIHEIAHLTHMNHSPKFWKHVNEICSYHKIAKAWLKENQYILLEDL